MNIFIVLFWQFYFSTPSSIATLSLICISLPVWDKLFNQQFRILGHDSKFWHGSWTLSFLNHIAFHAILSYLPFSLVGQRGKKRENWEIKWNKIQMDTQKWLQRVAVESQTRILTELPKPSFFFFTKQTSYRRLDSLLLGGLVKRVLAAVGTAKPKAVWLQGGS